MDTQNNKTIEKDGLILNEDGKIVIGVKDYSITNVVIPEGVEEVGENAFSYCYQIEMVTFPSTLRKLGKSEISQFYGINGREEAKAYIAHPILRERLVEISEAVLNNEKSVYEIFGNDAIKVRSCILLFESVSDIPVFKQIKSKYRW